MDLAQPSLLHLLLDATEQQAESNPQHCDRHAADWRWNSVRSNSLCNSSSSVSTKAFCSTRDLNVGLSCTGWEGVSGGAGGSASRSLTCSSDMGEALAGSCGST